MEVYFNESLRTSRWTTNKANLFQQHHLYVLMLNRKQTCLLGYAKKFGTIASPGFTGCRTGAIARCSHCKRPNLANISGLRAENRARPNRFISDQPRRGLASAQPSPRNLPTPPPVNKVLAQRKPARCFAQCVESPAGASRRAQMGGGGRQPPGRGPSISIWAAGGGPERREQDLRGQTEPVGNGCAELTALTRQRVTESAAQSNAAPRRQMYILHTYSPRG